jgi:hypothetical protein
MGFKEQTRMFVRGSQNEFWNSILLEESLPERLGTCEIAE